MEVIQSLCPCRASGREEDSFSRSTDMAGNPAYEIQTILGSSSEECQRKCSELKNTKGKTPNPSYQTQTIKPRITAGRGTFSTATRANERFSPGSTSSGLARSSTYPPTRALYNSSTRALYNSSTRALYSQPRPDALQKFPRRFTQSSAGGVGSNLPVRAPDSEEQPREGEGRKRERDRHLLGSKAHLHGPGGLVERSAEGFQRQAIQEVARSSKK